MLWLLIIVSIIALDQTVKYIINKKVSIGKSMPTDNKLLYITHVENTGIALSLFENKGYIVIPLTIITQIVMLYCLYKFNKGVLRLALSFIIGGGFGNLMDRLAKDSVTDFFQLRFGSHGSPIFNVADIFIFFGAIMFSIKL